MITASPTKAIPRKRTGKNKLPVADRASVRSEQRDTRAEDREERSEIFDRFKAEQEARSAERNKEGATGEIIELIALSKIHRHPLNRKIDPTDPEVIALAESIRERGQLEPLRVRMIPSEKDAYQLISGERRYTALNLLQRPTARCIVVDVDPANALVEVAVANSHRQDLNPIQRAELMQQLMKPVHQGGAAMSLTEAGAVFGLRSESGCKNAMRLLKLPDSLKQLLISGNIPERAIRQLIPFTVAPAVMKEIETDLTSDNDYQRAEALGQLMSSDGQPDFITYAISQHTRPISEDIKHHHGWQLGGNHPCLFDWQAHADKLQIVEMPIQLPCENRKQKPKVELRKFALNVKLWDKLQEPLVKKVVEEGKRKQKTAPATGKDHPPKKLTAKQQAALDKERAAKSEKQLDTFSLEWVQRLLRCTIAGRSSDQTVVCQTFPWLVSHSAGMGISLRSLAEGTLFELQLDHHKPFLSAVTAIKPPEAFYSVISNYWRLILWPVSNRISDKAIKRCPITPAGQLPDRLMYINRSELMDLAKIAQVSVETAWNAGATDDSDERRLISVWLCRHTKAQLQKLRDELDTEGSSTMGRDELAGCILHGHRPGRPLPLPKRLVKVAK